MKFFKERKLRIDILTTFSILIGITVLCEIFYSNSINRKLILDFEKEYYSKNISYSTAKYLNGYLEQIELLVQAYADHFDLKSSEKFKSYNKIFINGIKAMPYITSFYIGLKDNSYFQLRKLEVLKTYQSNPNKELPSYAKYAIKQIENKDGKLIETWDYLGEDLSVLSKETLQNISYLPTKRNWYMQVELKKSPLWSPVYVFSTTKLPGLTFSMPLGYYNDDSVIGVISVDISLDHFSELLKSIKMSDNSENYLINTEDEIVASSLDSKSYEINAKTDNLILNKATDSNNPVLRAVAKNLLNSKLEHLRFSVNGVDYIASLKKLERLPLFLVSISPQSDFTAEFENVKKSMLLISLILFVISFCVIFLLSKKISTPISALCASAKAVGEMQLDEYPNPPKSNISEIKALANAMNLMKLSVSTFAKYAPKNLVRKLVNKGEEPVLEGRTKEITLLFSDIEKFSTVSERLPAEYLVLHLSEYFDELTKEIMNYNGVIDKYIGDSIMAIWGAPDPDENQVINACYAALGCQTILEQLKQKWEPLGKPPLPTRIGIHTGQAIVGNIGSRDRMSFTALGDTVNIASRLEGANKYYGTKILVSESVERIAKGRILFRVIDRLAFVGKTSGVTVYEPLCAMKDVDNEDYYQLIDICARSKEAFELYQEQEFEKALNHYKRLLSLFPNLNSSIAPLIKRCEELMKEVPSDWNGIYHLTGK